MARILCLFALAFAVFGICQTKEEKKKDTEPVELSKDVAWKKLEFAVEGAEQDKKLVLIFIGKNWCKPCKKLAKSLNANEEFKELSKLFHMAAALDDSTPLDNKYDIDGKYAPKIIFQDSKGKVLTGITNGGDKTRYFYKKADKVVESMKKALAKLSLDNGFGKDYAWLDYADGLAEAKNTGKPIMMIIHQDWCSSCQRLKPKIAESKELIEMSKDFIMINTEEEVVTKNKAYAIDGVYYPRIFFLDNNGEVLKDQWNLDTEHKHVKYYFGEPEEIMKGMKRVKEHMAAAMLSLDNGLGKHIDWKSYKDGLALSKEQKKPMVLIIHKSYCGACKALKPKIRKSEELAELSKQFIMVNTLDDEEPNEEQYDIDGAYIPRIFFLDSHGMVEPSIKNERADFKKVQYAYGEASQIIENMKKALDMNLGEREAKKEPEKVASETKETTASPSTSWFTLEDGLKEAKKSHRAAMVIFFNSWCSFSKELITIMKDSSDLQKLSEHFVMIGAEDDKASTNAKYDLDGTYTPRIIFLDNNGNVRSDINNTETEYPSMLFYYKTAEQVKKAMETAKESINVSIARGFGDFINWQTYPKGKEIAKAQNKPMMMIIHRTWCSACKALKPKFAESYDLFELSKHFVMVNVEDDEEPEDTQFLVDGGYYPRIFFLDSNAKVVKELHNDDPSFLKYKFSFGDSDAITRAMRRAVKHFTNTGSISAEASHTTTGDNIPWAPYSSGLETAKQDNKPVFLLIHRSTCPACTAVHRMLVRDSEFMEKIKDFVMVQIEDDVDSDIADKYDVDGQYVPRIYFVDQEGEMMKKIWNVGTQYQDNKYYYYETKSVLRSMDKALKRISATKKESIKKEGKDEL
eukprot:gene5502-6187_t